jgi:hypothetical protein
MQAALDQITRFHNKLQNHVTLVVSLFQLLDHFDLQLEFAQTFWRQTMLELYQSTTAAERILKRWLSPISR